MTTKTLDRCRPACTPAPADAPATGTAPPSTLPAATPRADAWETAEAAHLAVELPGVGPDGLDLKIESDRLTISATATEDAPTGNLLGAEWRPRRYERTFVLGDDADRAAIEAQLRHGLLLVTVPRRAETRPRSIPVHVTTT